MAPLHGPLLVPEALRVVKFVISRAKLLIPKKPQAQKTVSLNTVRTYAQKPIAVHPYALIKQSKASHLRKDGTRAYSSVSNSNKKTFSGPKYDRSSFPSSRTSRAITQKGAAPFASTLRPNLTGGTLSRSAGGYSLGGAGRARQFSHTSGCQAQVVQNVSAGIRAFLINGSKARYDGVDSVSGEKRWKTVSPTQDTIYNKWEAAGVECTQRPKGSSLEFQLSPTITALLPSKLTGSASSDVVATTVEPEKTTSLNSPQLLQTLSSDFARAFRDLAIVTHDLNKLSAFGDLPVSLSHNTHGPVLRIRFPGCDARAVSALCDEAGIRRGIVVEDPAWKESRDVEMALLFPFAPANDFQADEEDDMQQFFGTKLPLHRQQQQQQNYHQSLEQQSRNRSFSTTSLYDLSSSAGSDLSTLHLDDLPSPSQSDALERGSDSSEIYLEEVSSSPPGSHSSPSHRHDHYHHPQETQTTSAHSSQQDFEGVEGIYRFLTALDNAGRPRR